MMSSKKYVVTVAHLVGFDLGDTATKKQIEDHGGTVEHLLSLGAIKPATTKETEL